MGWKTSIDEQHERINPIYTNERKEKSNEQNERDNLTITVKE
jgi:hypothetical protein